MNPILKQHIETYIDEIEQNRVFHSIVYCPLEILDNYLDVLRIAEVEPYKDLVDYYIPVASFLSSKITNGRCSNLMFSSTPSGSHEYEFEFPLQNIMFDELQKEITYVCSTAVTTVYSMNSDLMCGTTHIKINVRPSKYSF